MQRNSILLYLVWCIFVFWDRASCHPGWPQTCWVRGLQAWFPHSQRHVIQEAWTSVIWTSAWDPGPNSWQALRDNCPSYYFLVICSAVFPEALSRTKAYCRQLCHQARYASCRLWYSGLPPHQHAPCSLDVVERPGPSHRPLSQSVCQALACDFSPQSGLLPPLPSIAGPVPP